MSRSAAYDEGYFGEIARQVARSLRREDAKKAAVINSNADIFSAFDAGALAAMSAHEAAAEVLKRAGVRLNTGEDGTRALELFNFGMNWGRAGARYAGVGGTFAADDASAAAPHLLNKYL